MIRLNRFRVVQMRRQNLEHDAHARHRVEAAYDAPLSPRASCAELALAHEASDLAPSQKRLRDKNGFAGVEGQPIVVTVQRSA